MPAYQRVTLAISSGIANFAMREKSIAVAARMSAIVIRSAAMYGLSASRRSKNFNVRVAPARLVSAISGICFSSAASAGWLWRTVIISGVASIISVRRHHISMMAVSFGSRPNTFGSGNTLSR